MDWPPPRSRPPRLAAPAYALPLAVGAAALLLLVSLSLHALAMREWLQVGALERLRREEDVLASAAHQRLAALNGPHRCLLQRPLERWEDQGAACASSADVAALRRAEVLAVPVRLLSWQPGADGLSAVMELALEAGSGRSARQGRFGVRLEGVPPRAVDLRSRALAGALP